jgi:acetyltransferase-like isoleucine patch superfamily enzyme
MNKYITAILIFFLPSIFSRIVLRFFGAEIGKNVNFGLFNIIIIEPRNFIIKDNVKFRGFTYIKSKKIQICRNTTIGFLSKINLSSLCIGNNAEINSHVTIVGNKFSIGNFSKIFEYCFLECGEEILIGNHVGIGGHTLMFNHGTWSNFIEGGPVSFGSIEIEDNVWLPWRVFIMPGVKIGEYSIIGANSLVNKSIPSRVLAVGNPASIIKNNINNLDQSERLFKLNYLLEKFNKNHVDFKITIDNILSDTSFVIILNNSNDDLINVCNQRRISYLDYQKCISIAYDNFNDCNEFKSFLSLYGVRFELNVIN